MSKSISCGAIEGTESHLPDSFVPLSVGLMSIYNAIQDDESRDLFIRRLNRMFTHEQTRDSLYDMMAAAIKWDVIRIPSVRSNPNAELKIAEFIKYKLMKCIIIWGAGVCGSQAKFIFKSFGVETVAFVDNDPEKWGTVYKERPVISPEVLFAEYSDYYVAIGQLFGQSCYQQLLRSGFKANRIIIFSSIEEQYFGVRALRPVPNEVYVDIGVLDGNTLAQFSDFCGGAYKEIFAIEANKNCIPDISRFIQQNGLKNVHLLHKGAYSATGTMYFYEHDNLGASKIADYGHTEIETIRLDDLLAEKNPTLIKMDIEGAELEALKGASETIRRYKPRLAISIYHRTEDIVDILAFIHYLVPEYRFWIRQHFYFLGLEQILYAVCTS